MSAGISSVTDVSCAKYLAKQKKKVSDTVAEKCDTCSVHVFLKSYRNFNFGFFFNPHER